jgi:hypothetical protein
MKYLLNIITPENSFSLKLQELFKKYPTVDVNALGMKPNWEQEDLWK